MAVERAFSPGLSEWDGTPWAGTQAAPTIARSGPPAVTTVTPQVIPVQSVPYLDARSMLSLSPVQRAMSLICGTIADMPWTEWRGDELLPPSRLVRRPLGQPWMTRREWTFRVVATTALFNVAYLLHVGGRSSEGTVSGLLPIPPQMIQPGLTDPFGLLPPNEYYIAGKRIDTQFVRVVRRMPVPGITDQAMALIDLARREFTAYVAADVHMSRYWQAGGPTTTVITTDQELEDNDADRIADRWVERRAMGSDRPAVLGKGAHAEPFGADPTTQSAVEARREIAAEVGRYFGLPSRIMNAPAGDSETYANVEQDRQDLLGYTLRGYMGPIEDAISEELPGDPITARRMEFDPSRFLQGDLASRATAWSSLVTSGIVDPDEARLKGFGLPPRATPPSSGQAPVGATPVITATVAEGVPA